MPAEGHVAALDPSGQRIAVAGFEAAPVVLDVATGRQQLVLEGHDGPVNDLDWSPDGGLIATAGSEGTVRLWDARTGEQRLTFHGHSDYVDQVRFSPDGSVLASLAAADGVRLWAVDIGDLIGMGERKLSRGLTDEECRQYLHRPGCV